MPGFKGQTTSTGKPIVQFQGKSYQVPQRGISATLKPSSSTGPMTQNTRWTEPRKTQVKGQVSALAKPPAGSALSSRVIENTIARGVKSPGPDGTTIFTTNSARVMLNKDGSVKQANSL
jgi:hypothetical protein